MVFPRIASLGLLLDASERVDDPFGVVGSHGRAEAEPRVTGGSFVQRQKFRFSSILSKVFAGTNTLILTDRTFRWWETFALAESQSARTLIIQRFSDLGIGSQTSLTLDSTLADRGAGHQRICGVLGDE